MALGMTMNGARGTTLAAMRATLGVGTADLQQINAGYQGLIELLRQLLERQAIRRMEGGSLTDKQLEEMGQALMKLEAKIHELAAQFGLTSADLNLELGPLGNLLPK